MEIEPMLPFDADTVIGESISVPHAEPFVRLICGDVIDTLRTLDAGSVHCMATSPPYFNLRHYDLAPRQWDDGTVHCLGLEPSVELYVAHLVEVFHEVRRVLRDDGNFWLNIADSYAASGKHLEPTIYKSGDYHKPARRKPKGMCGKNLLLVPEQLIVALRTDGWIVRQVNIWHKPNAMCSSAKDRTTSAFEYVYHLVKSDRYYFDADAIAEPLAQSSMKRYQHVLTHHEQYDPAKHKHGAEGNPSPMEVLTRGAARIVAKGTKNRRNVWTIPTHPFRGAHFAAWPERLCEILIKAGCPESGIVCDPFSGSGRTGIVAKRLGRSFIGIDANPNYIAMADRAIRGIPTEGAVADKQAKTGNPTYAGFNTRGKER